MFQMQVQRLLESPPNRIRGVLDSHPSVLTAGADWLVCNGGKITAFLLMKKHFSAILRMQIQSSLFQREEESLNKCKPTTRT